MHAFELNHAYLSTLRTRLHRPQQITRVHLQQADFFATDWCKTLAQHTDTPLILGNFPWVTNATLGAMGSDNLPEKSNFSKQNGFDAISGKANFDISEWMLLEMLRALQGRAGDIAMLVKTSVARKVLAHAER